MKVDRSSNAFILGCERSGSTWFSNVLDAHPDVEFFMEPFAEYARLFPGFPSRNLHLDHNSDSMADVLIRGYDDLQKIKYLLFYKRNKSLRWKKIDRLIVNIFTRIGRLQRLRPPVRLEQFASLNLNQATTPLSWQTKKNEIIRLTVTKELRLNFKVGLLQRVFPKAKYIITVRHPGAQVASIMKRYSRGNLGEQRQSLLSLYAYMLASKHFDKYSEYMKCLDGGTDVSEMLLLWWLINYETVIEDCKRYNLDYMVVYNDSLSEAPEAQFQEIYSFLELDYTQAVSEYIRHSTRGARTGRSGDAMSPIYTVRDSSQYSRATISSLDEEMKRNVSSLFERFDVIDELRRYDDFS